MSSVRNNHPNKNYFTQSDLINDRHWNKRLIKRLLPEPHIVQLNQLNLKSRSFRWVKQVVFEAEQHPEFIAHLKRREQLRAERVSEDEQRKFNLISSAAAAYLIDIKKIDIKALDEFGMNAEQTFHDVFLQMRSVAGVFNQVNNFDFDDPRFPIEVMNEIKQRLFRKIADEIPRLALEVGFHIALIKLGIPHTQIDVHPYEQWELFDDFIAEASRQMSFARKETLQ